MNTRLVDYSDNRCIGGNAPPLFCFKVCGLLQYQAPPPGIEDTIGIPGKLPNWVLHYIWWLLVGSVRIVKYCFGAGEAEGIFLTRQWLSSFFRFNRDQRSGSRGPGSSLVDESSFVYKAWMARQVESGFELVRAKVQVESQGGYRAEYFWKAEYFKAKGQISTHL